MADPNLDARIAPGNPVCPTHAGIILPALIACPLCAQEARQRAFRRQLQEWRGRQAEAAQPLPRPATEALRDAAD